MGCEAGGVAAWLLCPGSLDSAPDARADGPSVDDSGGSEDRWKFGPLKRRPFKLAATAGRTPPGTMCDIASECAPALPSGHSLPASLDALAAAPARRKAKA